MIITRRDGSKETVENVYDFMANITETDIIIEDDINIDGIAYMFRYIPGNKRSMRLMLCFSGRAIGILLLDIALTLLISPMDKDEADMYMTMYTEGTNMEELFDRLKYRSNNAICMIENACVNTRPISNVKQSN